MKISPLNKLSRLTGTWFGKCFVGKFSDWPYHVGVFFENNDFISTISWKSYYTSKVLILLKFAWLINSQKMNCAITCSEFLFFIAVRCDNHNVYLGFYHLIVFE